MILTRLNNQLKAYFPQEKIIFGGSFITGRDTQFSDLDVYIIFDGIYEFYRATRDKEKLRGIKNVLDKRLNLHLMPRFFLRLGFYYIQGVYFDSKNRQRKFFNAGDAEVVKLNRLKLCLKYLVLYKIHEQAGSVNEKDFHDLQKSFYFLTQRKEDDVEEIENNIELEVKKNKTFIFKDWLFYCLRFKKIMPKDFEQRIISCLLNLKRFVNTQSDDYRQKFYQNYKHLAGRVKTSRDVDKMFEMIDRYVFLIFVV